MRFWRPHHTAFLLLGIVMAVGAVFSLSPERFSSLFASVPSGTRPSCMDGTETIGVFQPSTYIFYLRNSNTTGYANFTFTYRPSGIGATVYPVVGDWNKDWKKTVGLFDATNGRFYYTDSMNGQTQNYVRELPSMFRDTFLRPLAGDWDGDGDDGLGLYDPSLGIFYIFKLDPNSLHSTAAYDTTGITGMPNGLYGKIPFAGDWDRDGKDSVGIFLTSNSSFNFYTYPVNQYNRGPVGKVSSFGEVSRASNAIPVIGNWKGGAGEGLGLFYVTAGNALLKDTIETGYNDIALDYGPAPSPLYPIFADWCLPECTDTRDNDGDGKIDSPEDPECFIPEWESESRVCGNGLLETNEECDDGNRISNDGCESTCTLKCYDNDPQNSPQTRGTVRSGQCDATAVPPACNFQTYQISDECIDRRQVMQYSCPSTPGGNVSGMTQYCPNGTGCMDGQCIAAAAVANAQVFGSLYMLPQGEPYSGVDYILDPPAPNNANLPYWGAKMKFTLFAENRGPDNMGPGNEYGLRLTPRLPAGLPASSFVFDHVASGTGCLSNSQDCFPVEPARCTVQGLQVICPVPYMPAGEYRLIDVFYQTTRPNVCSATIELLSDVEFITDFDPANLPPITPQSTATTPLQCIYCGDGWKNPSMPEECDDGNDFSGDGCSNVCQIEPGCVCDPDYGSGYQSYALCWCCGDGVVSPGYSQCVPSCSYGQTCWNHCRDTVWHGEECDDGNSVLGDGCTNQCTREYCGDGIVNNGEQCDDGKQCGGDHSNFPEVDGRQCLRNADCITRPNVAGNRYVSVCQTQDAGGCSAACRLQPGWACTGSPSVCRLTTCGNNSIDTGENCDDGNTSAGDGCSVLCLIETGWLCEGTPSSCHVWNACIDSDGGMNYAVAGEAKGASSNANGNHITRQNYDNCSGANTLAEAYCPSSLGLPSFFTTTCPLGCAAGFCRQSSSAFSSAPSSSSAASSVVSSSSSSSLPPSLQAQVEGTPSARPGSSFSLNYRLRNTGGKAINWKIRIPLSQVPLDQEQHVDIASSQPPNCIRTYDDWYHIPAAECTFTLDTNVQIDFPVNFQVAGNAPCTMSRTYEVKYLNASGQIQTGPALSGTLQANCASSSSSTSSVPPPSFQAQVTGVPSGAPGSTIALTFRLRNIGTGKAENWKIRIPLNQGGALDVSTTQPPNCVRIYDDWNGIPAVECAFSLDPNGTANFPVNFEVAPTAPCNTSRIYSVQYINASGQLQSTGNQQLAGTLSATCPVSSSSSSVNVCGNSVVDPPGEQCDDGHLLPGDGCSAACRREIGWNCSGAPSICTTLCGDFLLAGTEQCDDGDLEDGDGCSKTCRLETFSSSSSSSVFSTPTLSSSFASSPPRCGDTRVDAGEQCERGAAACPIGWSCDYLSCQCLPLPPILPASSRAASSAPPAPRCGDRILTSGEQCESGIPCSATFYCTSFCQCLPIQGMTSSSSSAEEFALLSSASSSFMPPPPRCGDSILNYGEECEVGMLCPAGQVCDGSCLCLALFPAFSSSSLSVSGASSSENVSLPVCGNGLAEQDEECDDQNLIDGDGCSPFCALERGFACIGSPSICRTVCGDGIRTPPEECDDRNVIDGDGCSSICTTEHAAPPPPPEVIPVCGNGILEGQEQCDDRNPFDGDGCSATCTIELPAASSSVQSSLSSLSSISSLSSSSSSVILLPPSSPERQGNPLVWVAVGVVAFLLLLTVFLLLRMRKRNEE